ncbi:MAG: hypothetical protein VXY00_02390 [Candidatus Latescibacterota bacterium]|nr:hypothetical protein [Candidatus Latescibacterota bacterium]
MANTLGDTILQHLKYVDGVEGILGQFYYLSDPDQLQQGIERWLLHTPEGRAWMDNLGFVNKEAVIKVIEQIETNLEESSRDLVTKIQTLRSYVDAKGPTSGTAE